MSLVSLYLENSEKSDGYHLETSLLRFTLSFNSNMSSLQTP